ncbi:uncharacterized protein JCM6883_006812 [Sporobolomyces salmoneus]|uniref:uncharacterized protein n=1 Tax=Sporobolomyces salmoneus TaxID=183962 RepID=UPI003173DF52
MVPLRGGVDDNVPQSPAFATSSAFAPVPSSSSMRPDHSTLDLSSATTTPKIPPPPLSDDPEEMYGEKERYGGGFRGGGEEDDHLIASSGSSNAYRLGGGGGSSQQKRSSPFETLFKLIGGTLFVVFLLIFLSRLSVLPSPSPSHRAKVAHHLTPYMPQSVLSLIRPVTGPSAPHPIIPLITNARDSWSKKLKSQSTTFDRATKNYKARYGMSPPPGFDKWFAFATQGKNHSLVDEYDQLMSDLKPYRSLSPQELRRRTAELAQIPGISIVSIRNGVAQVHSKSGKWAPALAFQEMIGTFVRDLPDMDIAVNEKPEGRVLPKIQKRVSMADYGLEGTNEPAINMSDPMITPHLKRGFSPEWKRDGSIWESYRRSCPPDSAARRLVETVRSAETNGALTVQGRSNSKSELTRRKQSSQAWPSTREMTFSQDLDASFDICDTPSLHSLHSAFFSDQRSIDYLYPIFSPSKPPGFADILIPSHHYWSPSSEFTYEWEVKRGRTKNPSDLNWDIKKSTSYWRGKVTRGADTPAGHGASFQKQRLVKMSNQGSMEVEKVLVGFETKSAGLDSISAPVGIVNQVTSDIAMACDPSLGECSYLRSLGYRVEPPAPLSEAWKHKFVLDIDEIGFSPKFPALMESKSAVVKSSIQREFWRGWAQPWKHFIPLSSSFSELYNLQTFFTGLPPSLTTPRGNETVHTTKLSRPSPIPALPENADGSEFNSDTVLKEIAESGSRWKKEHLRKEDMECYVYRLMVEWANLVAPISESREEKTIAAYPICIIHQRRLRRVLFLFRVLSRTVLFRQVRSGSVLTTPSFDHTSSLSLLHPHLCADSLAAMSLVVFDDTDVQSISYSSNWVGYQGLVGSIDARDWVGSSFHACRAEPLDGKAPCFANITFKGSSIELFAEHSSAQQRYFCALLDDGDGAGQGGGAGQYKWYNGSRLTSDGEGTEFVWSLNNTRCAVGGLDANKEHTLTFGQLAEDTQGIGITLDYYTVDGSASNGTGNPTWSSDFVSVDAPPNLSWAGSSNSSTSSTSTRASATSSSSMSSAGSKTSTSLDSTSTPASDSSSSSSSSSDSGGGTSASTGIGLGVGLGGLALLLLGGFFLWKRKKNRRLERTGSMAPTETTYGGFQSVSGGSPVSRNGRGRFPSTSQSYLPSYNQGGAPSEYGGGRVPEVQPADDQIDSPATTHAGGDSRFLANPATFRER